MNFETCLFYRQQQQQQQPGQPETKTVLSPAMISAYAVPALKGFVKSISLSKGSSLQDTLRFLTLLFDYGHQSDMSGCRSSRSSSLGSTPRGPS